MSKLANLNQRINSVSSVEEAIKLLEGVLPNQSATPTKTSGGINNCALVAEFAIKWMNPSVNYMAMCVGSGGRNFPSPYDGIPFSTNSVDAYLVEIKGGETTHNMALLREGNMFALFHAWDGKFNVFPKLNNGTSYNSYGPGMNGLAAAKAVIAKHSGGAAIEVHT